MNYLASSQRIWKKAAPAVWKATGVRDVSARLVAAAAAPPHCPSVIADKAACTATRADEHAVSTVTEGPLRLNVYDSLPAATLSADDVALYGVAGPPCCASTCA
jgi:hypothetical protein